MISTKKPIQLELKLWAELCQAELAPEKSDVRQLCLHLEQAIAATPLELQLPTVAAALVQLIEIFAQRAEVLLTDWEAAHSGQGPVLQDED